MYSNPNVVALVSKCLACRWPTSVQGLQCQVAERDRRAAELSHAVSERDEALVALRRQVRDMNTLAAALKEQGAQQVMRGRCGEERAGSWAHHHARR